MASAVAVDSPPLSAPRYTIDQLDAFPNDGCRYELLGGTLLVSPQARTVHQIVATRISSALSAAVGQTAWVVGPGIVQRPPDTHLEPDVLVFPSTFAADTLWREIRGWWLAVEIFSPSTRIYDRDFKRDAYLALGVAEVWLVDIDATMIFVSRRSDATRDIEARDALRWQPPGASAVLTLDVRALFAGLR